MRKRAPISQIDISRQNPEELGSDTPDLRSGELLHIQTVGIFVCSRNFSEAILKTISSLYQQEVPEGWALESINIVWNNSRSELRERLPDIDSLNSLPGAVRVDEYFEPKTGIPFARNKALIVAKEKALDWICFIDDDCHADPHWLKGLISVASRYCADVVAGGWRFVPAGSPSSWLPQSVMGTQHYLLGSKKAREGQYLPTAFTRNVMFSSAIFRRLSPDEQRFDERLVGQGGSDVLFFSGVSRAGLRIVYAPKAAITESYTGKRLTLKWHLNRKIRNTQNKLSRLAKTGEQIASVMSLVRSSLVLILGIPLLFLLAPISILVPITRPLVGSIVLNAALYAGCFTYILGFRYYEYSGVWKSPLNADRFCTHPHLKRRKVTQSQI